MTERRESGKERRLLSRVVELQAALDEANETLDAIRNGEVDAVVVTGAAGQMIYALENADRPYRVIVEQMKEGAVTMTRDGVILYGNPSFADLVGAPSEHLLGRALAGYVRESDLLTAMFPVADQAPTAELSVLTVSGELTPVRLSITELVPEEGAEAILCGIFTDLTSAHLRAHELAEANANLADQIAERTKAEQSLSIALDAADMDSWDLSVGAAQAAPPVRISPLGRAPLLGHEGVVADMAEHFVPEDRAAVLAAFENAGRTGRVDFERRVRRDDGATRWVHVRGRLFQGEAGSERLTGVAVDVTDRRLIDEQLRQSQKLEAIGQLTGGIAHDFNNLLMIIGGSLEALSRRATLEGPAKRLLEAARMGVARGAKLNEQLLAFARRQDMREEVVCVNDLLPNFQTLLDRAIGETVTVEVDEHPQLWFCRTDSHQLETAILNLAINARDAMVGGGHLRLTTANAVIDAKTATRWQARPGEYVVVSVIDDGRGMDDALIARAFEPFFTTKGVGEGTGLGLSQVHGFANQSGGFVSIASTVGKGTTVSIHLPRVEQETVQDVASESGPAAEPASGSVLLVEDDAQVRAAARAMLEELGYQVREVDSGPAALTALEEEAAHVDLVFSDVIMSTGMNGVELARIIHRDHPELPVLLTSGYTAQRLTPAVQDHELPLLRKPYTLDELASALRSAAPLHPDGRRV